MLKGWIKLVKINSFKMKKKNGWTWKMKIIDAKINEINQIIVFYYQLNDLFICIFIINKYFLPK